MIRRGRPARAAAGGRSAVLCWFVRPARMSSWSRATMQTQDKFTDKQLSDEQSREIAETIREELARRRISRQSLAEQAKLSLSTLEKVLGGRRPFTLATTVRLEQALGVSLRQALDAASIAAPVNGDIAPDALGAYSHRGVAWLEGIYVTLRPSFGDKDAIYAY